ncbi:MAG: CehA/McbA family metallohydrolase [Myxococcales bacterium]|nr:CehA/McbA family metallohydrolase [Myxococcales bacterium]
MRSPLPILLALGLNTAACTTDETAVVPASDAAETPDVASLDAAESDVAPLDVESADAIDDAPDVPTQGDGEEPGPDTYQGPTVQPCPMPGHALVTNDFEPLRGPDAIGAKGDWLLMNEVAAFVIQGPVADKTYYYYGGLPIDASPIETLAGGQCIQSGSGEMFGELAFAVGSIDPGNFAESVLRGFAAESFEVIADGADGGPVTLRVTGTDRPFWLVEYELIRRIAAGGGKKLFSEPLGVALAIDYTLTPGDPVLRIDLHVRNLTAEARTLVAGSVSFPSDFTTTETAPTSSVDLGGFGLRSGAPWMAGLGGPAAAASSSWALSGIGTEYATISLSGAEVFIDLGQLFAPLAMGPAGDEDTATQTWFLAVTPGGSDAASAALQPHLPDVQKTAFTSFAGVVRTAPGGEGFPADVVPFARILITRPGPNGTRVPVGTTSANVHGDFVVQVPDMADVTVKATHPGSPPSAELALPTGDPAAPLELVIGRSGRVAHDVQDDDGTAIPARIQVFQGDALVHQLFALPGPGEFELPPGDYEIVVSRGYEYERVATPVTIVADQTAPLDVTLVHSMDTAGYLSFDGHVHAGPSGDSTVPLAERIRSAAADGLEIIGHTDHEIIVDPEPSRADSGVQDWVASIPGEELTATSPEHHSVWDMPPDPTHPRGRPIVWYQKGVAELVKEVHDRGGLVALNHPRTTKSCAYLCLIGWDRVAGTPTLNDPTRIGLPAGTALWTWDYDALELYNGLGNLFAVGKDERAGIFDDWMSFLNHGHRIPAVASSDVHDGSGVGSPRTYLVSTADPATLGGEVLREAISSGDLTLSAGAFALASVGDVGIGGDVTATPAIDDGDNRTIPLTIDVRGTAMLDVTHVSVFLNCDEVLRLPASAPYGTQKFKDTVTIPVPKDAHVVVVAFGKDPMPRGFDGAEASRVPRALTNPIYVDADGDAKWTAPGGKTCSYTLVE